MYYNSVIENLARHSVTAPDKLCLADNKHSYTYAEVWSKVMGLADELKNKGVSKGSCVVVECDQTAAYMITEFAIQMLGGVFVPLEKNAAAERAIEISGDTEAVLHIGRRAELIPEIPYMELKATCDYDNDADVAETVFPARDDVSEILFSTGTTGKSKGIVLTHGNDIAIAENVINGVKMMADNVELIPMPTSHSHGLRRTYANMVNGSSVVFIDGVMLLKKVFDMMRNYKVTSMDLSPSMLSIIFKLSKDQLGDFADVLDYIQLGSAPLPEEDKLHLSRILPKTRLYNFYGSTEAGCSCLLDFNEAAGKPGCIGKPAVNAKFIVVDENRNIIESSIDNTGFLASSGSINMKCYFKAPELTAETMEDGFIYTKDVGYIDEEGFVYMLGRKDDVINFGGVKIAPEEIEGTVMKNDMIDDCACVPVKDELTGQAPKLYIQLAPAAADTYSEKEFRKWLATNLDANKQPKIIEIIDEIPRTFNGKIKRKELINR